MFQKKLRAMNKNQLIVAWGIVVAMVILCSGCATSFDLKSKEYTAEEYLTKGKIYAYSEQFDKDIEFYQKAIELDHNYIDAYYSLGLLYGKLEDYEKTKVYLKKVISLNPNYNTEVYLLLGTAYYDPDENLADYSKAIEYCNKAVELNPDLAEANYCLGISYQKLKDYDKAIKYISKSISLKPDFAEPYWKIGYIYFTLGIYKEAKNNLLKANELFKQQGASQIVKEIEELLKELP